MTKAVFIADATGAALNCVAIAQQLAPNVQPILLADRSLGGIFKRYGFEEFLVEIHQGEIWGEHAEQGQQAFRASTLEQIDSYVSPYWRDIVDGAVKAYPLMDQALRKLKPDVIVVDDVIIHPAILNPKKPWARVVSCNELEIPDPALPPALSGYGSFDRTPWAAFREKYQHAIRPWHAKFNRFLTSISRDPLPDMVFHPPSPFLNFVIYPEAVRYPRSIPLDKTIHLNGCVREDPPYRHRFQKPLVYLGYGSVGCCEHRLILSQLEALAREPWNVIAAVGPYKNRYPPLPDNVLLEEFPPQPSLIPRADLVIHHGGNNTFNEALFFGKPHVVLPFAWDGHDNAARVQDLNLGRRLHRYRSSPQDLVEAVRQTLADRALSQRLEKIAREMQSLPGAVRAGREILKILSLA